MVESLLEVLAKGRSQTFCKPMDIQSVTNAIGKIVSSKSMWSIVNQVGKLNFPCSQISCGQVVNNSKKRDYFLIKWKEITLTQFLVGATGIVARWHNENSILKDTLQSKIWRTWIKIGANSFIKAWVNIMTRKSKKVPVNYWWHKNPSLLFKKHCTKIDEVLLILIDFFFSKT